MRRMGSDQSALVVQLALCLFLQVPFVTFASLLLFRLGNAGTLINWKPLLDDLVLVQSCPRKQGVKSEILSIVDMSFRP